MWLQCDGCSIAVHADDVHKSAKLAYKLECNLICVVAVAVVV